MQDPSNTPPNRCRLVILASLGSEHAVTAAKLAEASAGGDIASIIVSNGGLDEDAFQKAVETIAGPAQAAGIALIVAGDTRVAGRVRADGIHVEGSAAELGEAVTKFQRQMSVGTGGATNRDDALTLGEMRPDYILFGRIGHDTRAEPHQRNLDLGEWWATMIEIPCIVMGGNDVASVEAVAATGCEFVALSSAVLGDGVNAREAVERANAILDAHAPPFD